jgi:hypothetical protein
MSPMSASTGSEESKGRSCEAREVDLVLSGVCCPIQGLEKKQTVRGYLENAPRTLLTALLLSSRHRNCFRDQLKFVSLQKIPHETGEV